MEPSTYQRATEPEREFDGAWDTALLTNLLHLEYVWAVVLTTGTGELVHSQQRRDLPAHCPDLLDLVSGALANAGERLELGQLRVTVFMFSGGLVVGRHTESGASAFVLASPEANLGQLLAHIRRVHLGGELIGEGQ